jgi:hypothetical protein
LLHEADFSNLWRFVSSSSGPRGSETAQSTASQHGICTSESPLQFSLEEGKRISRRSLAENSRSLLSSSLLFSLSLQWLNRVNIMLVTMNCPTFSISFAVPLWILLLVPISAFPWPGPQPTLEAAAFTSQPPAPTNAPEVPHDLFIRDLYPANLCGW